ncbi:hypothetical protein D3C78_1131060 [compost metagenome]
MLSAQQIKRTADVRIERIQGPFTPIFTPPSARALARAGVWIAHHIQQCVVKGLLAMRAVEAKRPTVVPAVSEIGEDFSGLNVIARPVCGCVDVAIVMRT